MRRLAIVATVCAAFACVSPVAAVPVFYVSTQDSGAVPEPVSVAGVPFGSTGTLHIWARSDVRLSGVSLDLIETGGAIKFTGLDVPNPNDRWAFVDGPQIVTNSAVNNIGGVAIPLVHGRGIGPGSLEETDVLLASVNYLATGGGTLQLALRVGSNGISDFDGNASPLRFGTESAPILFGDQFGATGPVGSIQVDGPPPQPPVVADARLGDRAQGSLINHTLMTLAGDTPITWSNLLVSGPGPPVHAPNLSPNGEFTWNTAGSPLGLYDFDVTATNAVGSDVGRLSLNLVAPPPPPPPVLPSVVNANLGNRPLGGVLTHRFTTSAGDSPIEWDNLVISGPGSPANPPSLTSDGLFSWNTSGSTLGLYNFDVTATNAAGSDIGRLWLNLVAPLPQPPSVNDTGIEIAPGETVVHTFTAFDADTSLAELTWSNLVFEGDSVAIPPTFDPLTRLFSWNTAGSPDGTYKALVTVSDPMGFSDTGALWIGLGVGMPTFPGGEPEIPEPATMTHLSLATLGLLIAVRRSCLFQI
jgi:hypothetical protein